MYRGYGTKTGNWPSTLDWSCCSLHSAALALRSDSVFFDSSSLFDSTAFSVSTSTRKQNATAWRWKYETKRKWQHNRQLQWNFLILSKENQLFINHLNQLVNFKISQIYFSTNLRRILEFLESLVLFFFLGLCPRLSISESLSQLAQLCVNLLPLLNLSVRELTWRIIHYLEPRSIFLNMKFTHLSDKVFPTHW